MRVPVVIDFKRERVGRDRVTQEKGEGVAGVGWSGPRAVAGLAEKRLAGRVAFTELGRFWFLVGLEPRLVRGLC